MCFGTEEIDFIWSGRHYEKGDRNSKRYREDDVRRLYMESQLIIISHQKDEDILDILSHGGTLSVTDIL